MEKVNLKEFKVIGISIRTTNENGQAATDIPTLWNKFMTESILEKIPNKISNDIYSIYTEYESDHTKAYTTILGCKVEHLNEVPEGMVAKIFDEENYTKFMTKGDLNKGIVYNKWEEIWNIDLDRTYSADFEIYGEKAQNPADAEVEIFIATEK